MIPKPNVSNTTLQNSTKGMFSLGKVETKCVKNLKKLHIAQCTNTTYK